jgi:hypothetical protein
MLGHVLDAGASDDELVGELIEPAFASGGRRIEGARPVHCVV